MSAAETTAVWLGASALTGLFVMGIVETVAEHGHGWVAAIIFPALLWTVGLVAALVGDGEGA
ncbi:MAG TPA: hypothetical protein VGN13_12315 [Solirubrobacteraceae bacterium]|jgi:hypothetical protein